MSINEDSIHHLRSLVDLLLLFKVIRGSVHYGVEADVFSNFHHYKVTSIDIYPTGTV